MGDHPKTFCTIPFTRLEVGYQGEVWLCCPGWMPTSIGNVLHTHLLGLWRGPSAEDVRASVRDGSYRHCTRCPFLPGPSGPVQPWDAPPSTGRINQLYLSYDRTCNLTCPSCRKIPYMAVGPERELIETIQQRLLDGHVLEHVDRLYLSGSGDPFASPHGRALLKHLTPDTYPSLRICLCTNGLECTPSVWQELGQSTSLFQQVQISIDATCKETYRRTRGGDFSRLLDNIEHLKMRSRERHFDILFVFVVQESNFTEMPAFLDFAALHGASRVGFMEIRDWFSWQQDPALDRDYAAKAVHLRSHPRHLDFLRVLDAVREVEASRFRDRIDWMGFNRLGET